MGFAVQQQFITLKISEMEIKIIDESHLEVIVDGKIYSSEVLHKCFYWYGNKFSVEINAKEDFFIVDISELSKENRIKEILPRIKNDLIDFKTREIILNETKNIRDLLIVKAFAHDDQYDENPPGNVSDSIGFDPSAINTF